MPEEEAVKIELDLGCLKSLFLGTMFLLDLRNLLFYDVPNTKRLVFKMIPEASARMIALKMAKWM